MSKRSSQLDLFGGPEKPVGKDRSPVGTAPVADADQRTSARLPPRVHYGTSSWTFPGWKGIVWDRDTNVKKLSDEGLAAYSRHPLLRAVGIDRTYYGPVRTEVFSAWAAAVPAEFRFVVKAHEWLTTSRFASHARYGAQAGKDNPNFLNPEHALPHVVEPFVEGLGAKGGALVFQFSPQQLGVDFVDRLHGFLAALPKGPLYAVEVRNPELLTTQYAAALRDAGAVHVVSAWAQMPGVSEQVAKVPVLEGRALVGRWMLPPHGGLNYETARETFEPFDKLMEEDLVTRRAYAKLVAEITEAGKPAFVIVNNKAEGSAPLSVFKLAEETVAELEREERARQI